MIIAVLQKLLPKTLKKIYSPVNGEICVIEQFGRRKIVVSKLTQSGPVMEEIWREAMKKILKHIRQAQCKQVQNDDKSNEVRILVLGLGGGSIIKVLKKYFPDSRITAVDYDPIMVELGKKYLGLTGNSDIKIVIDDAVNFINKTKQQFDLIFVDLFSGDTIPKKTETEIFLRRIKEKLKEFGLVVFNRHYYQNHISEAKIFLDKSEEIFNDVSSKKILTNLLIFARR